MQLAWTCRRRKMKQGQNLCHSLPLIDNWSLFGHPLAKSPLGQCMWIHPLILPPAESSRRQSDTASIWAVSHGLLCWFGAQQCNICNIFSSLVLSGSFVSRACQKLKILLVRDPLVAGTSIEKFGGKTDGRQNPDRHLQFSFPRSQTWVDLPSERSIAAATNKANARVPRRRGAAPM